MSDAIADLSLKDAARQKYLNYAMSVITSRALPDVRDGLKPVQRRILYAMFSDLRLLPEKKELKCAKVVGEVLGNYHPHGDSAVYEALVRMAQEWVLRAPLVDGHGNFGSIDGDSAAAYRYTEAKLRPFAVALLEEIGQATVDFRDTFDGQRQEPIVLPSQSPLLLVNGATGIAVGIATNIPPHNLREVCGAAVALIEHPDSTVADLMKHIKAPDFPTGGQILNTKKELRAIYESGSGAVRVRGDWEMDAKSKRPQIVVTSIPYMVKKQELAAKIRDLALDKKLPQIVDVRDESTTDIRVVIELRPDAEPEKVMAYLFKTTDLESNFNVNLTCLVPAEGRDVTVPRQLDLRSILRHFLEFRFGTVKRRFEYELRILRERIHILDGFAKIFNDLDTAIKLIRKSKDKKDASEKLIAHFKLDDIQTNAILEMMLYRIASLEIDKIMQERREKRARADEIEAILGSNKKLWSVIKQELQKIAEAHGDKRRTRVEAIDESDVVEVSAEDFIIDEDQFVILTSGGWVKRQAKIASLDKVQIRPGDTVAAVAAGSTKALVVFFTNMGIAYTIRINDLPASRGHGDPVQKLFKFRDKERVIALISLDPRVTKDIEPAKKEGQPPKIHLVAVSSAGFGLRFAFTPFTEASTRAGRKFARVDEKSEIILVAKVTGTESLLAVTKEARAIHTKVGEINFLEGAGKGVTVIKLGPTDRVLHAVVPGTDEDSITVTTDRGGTHRITRRKYEMVGRGGRGIQIVKYGEISAVEASELRLPELPE